MVNEETGSADIATPSNIGQDDAKREDETENPAEENSGDLEISDDDIYIEQETLTEEELPVVIPDENIVYTADELEQWCSENRYIGGRVVLGGIITISEALSVYNSGHIVIDTGSYGLVYDGGSISMSKYEITGEGVDFPVLDIESVIEHGYWWEAGWNDVVQDMSITAAGKDGIGGVALRIRQDDGYSPTYDYYLSEGLIRSYGAGAIGLYLDELLDIHCIQIQVASDGCAAVYAPQGVNLYYCKLTAEGMGASVALGSGEILLNTCAANPTPKNVRVVNYRIAGAVGSRLYCPMRQYDSYFDPDYYITYLLFAGDGQPAVQGAFWTLWRFDSIDTSVLEKTVVQGSLNLPFRGLGLEDDFPIQLVVDVRSPDIPCISYINFIEDGELGAYVILSFWDTYEREDENVIIWRSDDGGESWYDFTGSTDIEWYGDRVCYYYKEITDPIMLQLEVLGKGESNVVILYSIDGEVASAEGGDRDGGDQNTVSNSGGGNTPDVDDTTDDGNATGSRGNGNNAGNDSGRDSFTGGSIIKIDTPLPVPDNEIKQPSTQNNGGLAADFADTIHAVEAVRIEAPTAPEEWESGDTAAISGKRLAAMIEANPKVITFIKSGIQVSVASSDLLTLGLGENQLFVVEIKKRKDNSFSVFFKVDDTLLSDLPFITYIKTSVFDGISLAEAVCADGDGNILPSEYDPGTGRLAVSMTGSGVFTLQEPQITEAVSVSVQYGGGLQEQDQGWRSDKQSPLFGRGRIAIAGCVVFLSAAAFVWYKRFRKGGGTA